MTDNEKEQFWAAHLMTKRNHRQARRSSFDAGWDAALAVFEKAHTPTDDEREALGRWLHLRFGHAAPLHQPATWDGLSERFKAAWLDLAGDAPARRSEEQEPSARMIDTYSDSDLRDAFGIPEPQGEPSDAHLSNVSINGVRQTWEQLYEREHEAHIALQSYRTMLSDMDRNASGRHQGDYDSHTTGNGGISAGNPHLTTGTVIGYDIGGREYVVPEPRERGTLSAWLRASGGEGR